LNLLVPSLTMKFVWLIVSWESVHCSPLEWDVCHNFNSGSLCMENGQCSGDIGISCYGAYISNSQELLKPAIEVAETPQSSPRMIDNSFRMSSILNTRADIRMPDVLSNNETVSNFMRILEKFAHIFKIEFPLLIVHKEYLTRVVARSKEVGRLLVQSDERSEFSRYFIQSEPVVDIRVSFSSITRYLYGLERTDELRRAIIGNLLPYVFVWLEIHANFGLPMPFPSTGLLEFLTSVSQFDPGFGSRWTIPVHQSAFHNSDPNPILFPLIDSDEFIPPAIFDKLSLREDTPVVEALDKIQSLISRNFQIDTARAVLYFIKHHPEISEPTRTLFCSATRYVWLGIFRNLHPISWGRPDSIRLVDLIDLFRVCGKNEPFFTIQERTQYVLPFFLSRRSPPITRIKIPHIFKWENGIKTLDLGYIFQHIGIIRPAILRVNRLRFVTGLHRLVPPSTSETSFLSWLIHELVRLQWHTENPFVDAQPEEFLSQPRRLLTVKLILRGVGICIATLFLEGDPEGTLQNALLDKSIRNIHLGSRTVREGILQVVDYPIWETLYSEDEIPTVLGILRANKQILIPLVRH
jgi:hypothetical protein